MNVGPVDIPVGDDDEAEENVRAVAELEAKLASTEAALVQLRDDALRRAADLDNTRKRLVREHERACDAAALRVVEKLLPVMDDLTRAIEAVGGDAGVPPHHVEALRLLDRRVYDVLKAEGLEIIAPKRGDAFDAEVHEAVMTTCDAELEPGTVSTPVAPGYRFKGQLLRAAAVEVCVEGEGA